MQSNGREVTASKKLAESRSLQKRSFRLDPSVSRSQPWPRFTWFSKANCLSIPTSMPSSPAGRFRRAPLRAGATVTLRELLTHTDWTTPSDLARYIIEVQQSLQGHANHVLSQKLTEEMVTPGKGDWGLGLQIGGAPSKRYFSHGGVNEGYESLFVAYEHEGDGAVVMTNAQGGSRLASEVMSSIAVAYDWPDFRPALRTEVKLDRATLARYVGTYELMPQFSITFTLEGDQLMTQATNQPKLPIYAESDRKFFLKAVDAEVEFFPGDKGQSYLILHQNGHEIKGVKK